jgi:hypothetical protein
MTSWVELRKVVREARNLGAVFRVVGADVEIEGDLPRDLRDALPANMLWQYLGAARADKEAEAFLVDSFGVEPVLIEDVAVAESAMAALDGIAVLGIDIETSPSDARPAPIRINVDGALSALQPKWCIRQVGWDFSEAGALHEAPVRAGRLP